LSNFPFYHFGGSISTQSDLVTKLFFPNPLINGQISTKLVQIDND